jgi:uncharacterized glyoxalase superfamily protein PhnB
MSETTLRGKLSVAISANDVQRSLDFYVQGLGFTEVNRMEKNGALQGAMIAAGDVHLGVSQDDFSKGRDRKKGIGLSIHVETEQDVSALARRVKQAGIAFDHEPGPLPWGPTGFSVKDPDGLTVFVSNPERKS